MKPTKAEKRLQVLMIVYVIMFAMGGLEFYFIPDKLLSNIYWVGEKLGFTPIPHSDERFWNFLSVSLMVTITTCCLIAAANIKKNRLFVSPVIFSKLASSITAILAFWRGSPKSFAYLVIFLTDFPLFVLAAIFYMAVDMESKFGRKTESAAAAPPTAPPPTATNT